MRVFNSYYKGITVLVVNNEWMKHKTTICDSKKLTFHFLYNCKNHCTHGFLIVKKRLRNCKGVST